MKNSVRTCVTCRKSENPASLLRLTLVDGKVIPDLKAIAPGRGAWVHKGCAAAAIKRGAFKFAFKLKQNPDVSELMKLIEMDAKDMKLK